MLIRHTEVRGRRVDVRVQGAMVTDVQPGLTRLNHEEVVDAAGGALLPGLHDHHLHLFAMAAAQRSIQLGPPNVSTPEGFSRVLAAAARRAPPGQWVRGVGYHESIHDGLDENTASPLDRDVLDRIAADRPIRVQHRSGALWVLNSAGLQAADLERESDPDVERDAAGRLTGRLWRWDARLGARLQEAAPDLRDIGAQLDGLGITGVTDATPDLDDAALCLLEAAVKTRTLACNVVLLGAPLDRQLAPGLVAGPYKILLRDHDLPGLDQLAARIGAAHAHGRAVAVHCVTREALLLTLATLAAVGILPGDRLEHGAVIPPELYSRLAADGLRVVTQPAFIAGRGDAYLRDVDPADLGCLYPYASLLEAGIPVAPSSDAPFGPLDPWQVIAAAAARRTESGQLLGTGERVAAKTALAGYLSAADDPGGPPRQISPGAPADLCLLAVPLEEALRRPGAEHIALTICGGT